jgi:peptide chain release factor subunit 1
LAETHELLDTERLWRIRQLHGGPLAVVSMYVTIPPVRGDAHVDGAARVDSLLHQVRATETERELDHRAMLSLRGDIAFIEMVRDAETHTPGAIAIFSCSGAGAFEVVSLPRAVRDRVVVDVTPWVSPLLGILDEHRRCFAAHVDLRDSHVWELCLGKVRDAGSLEGGRVPIALRPVNARREQNKAREHEKRRFHELAERLEALLAVDHDALLALGGHEDELSRLQQALAPAARGRLAGTFALDPATLNQGVVREQAEAILARYECAKHREGLAHALEVAAAGGRAAIGLDACLWAGTMAAVEDLYVQDGAIAPGVVCDRSRWFAVSGGRCPVCGGTTRHTDDVLDELAEAVVEQGGSVHHVRAESALEELIAACTVRFDLPLSS